MAELGRHFFAAEAVDVAPRLLHKVLTVGDASGLVVEVEAYEGAADPGSHGYRGPTPRTEVMFGSPGHLYVYFTYGMHWCANVVCGPVGVCSAVLIRALEPLTGLDQMRIRRPAARRDLDLTNGPAKLCAALGIDGEYGGVDVTDPESAVGIFDDGRPGPDDVVCTTRVGLSQGRDLLWRWYVADHPSVSRR